MDDKNKKPTGTRGVARGSTRRTVGKRMGAGRRRIVATRRRLMELKLFILMLFKDWRALLCLI